MKWKYEKILNKVKFGLKISVGTIIYLWFMFQILLTKYGFWLGLFITLFLFGYILGGE